MKRDWKIRCAISGAVVSAVSVPGLSPPDRHKETPGRRGGGGGAALRRRRSNRSNHRSRSSCTVQSASQSVARRRWRREEHSMTATVALTVVYILASVYLIFWLGLWMVHLLAIIYGWVQAAGFAVSCCPVVCSVMSVISRPALSPRFRPMSVSGEWWQEKAGGQLVCLAGSDPAAKQGQTGGVSDQINRTDQIIRTDQIKFTAI